MAYDAQVEVTRAQAWQALNNRDYIAAHTLYRRALGQVALNTSGDEATIGMAEVFADIGQTYLREAALPTNPQVPIDPARRERLISFANTTIATAIDLMHPLFPVDPKGVPLISVAKKHRRYGATVLGTLHTLSGRVNAFQAVSKPGFGHLDAESTAHIWQALVDFDEAAPWLWRGNSAPAIVRATYDAARAEQLRDQPLLVGQRLARLALLGAWALRYDPRHLAPAQTDSARRALQLRSIHTVVQAVLRDP